MIEVEILISVQWFKKFSPRESVKVVGVTENTEGSTSQRVLHDWLNARRWYITYMNIKYVFEKLNGIFNLLDLNYSKNNLTEKNKIIA